MLCKPQGLNLHRVIACGSGAIDLLRAAIPRKFSAVNSVGSWQWSLSDLKNSNRLDGRPIVGTVELTAVEPSIRSRVRPTASGKKSWLKLRGKTAIQSQFKRPKQRARVIQIAQKLPTRENLLVSGLAVALAGTSIRERLIKNSVARYATTLYAPQ